MSRATRAFRFGRVAPVVRRVAALLLAALPALASGGEGEHGHGEAALPTSEIVNFAILVVALVYFGRGPLREMFGARHARITGDIKSASELLSQAEHRNAEWQRRLADLDRELDDIRASARRRAEEERERILAEAADAAERIRRDAVASVEQELRRAQSALREEAANLSIELAAGILSREVGSGDRDRLMDEFIARVEQADGATGARGRA